LAEGRELVDNFRVVIRRYVSSPKRKKSSSEPCFLGCFGAVRYWHGREADSLLFSVLRYTSRRPPYQLIKIPVITRLQSTHCDITNIEIEIEREKTQTALPVLLAAQALRTLAMVHAASSFSHEVSRGAKADDHTLVTRGVYQ
jgi:hypothetical protein